MVAQITNYLFVIDLQIILEHAAMLLAWQLILKSKLKIK